MDLTEIERNQLAAILKIDTIELEVNFAKFTRAATEEYARMILGQRVFTRGRDMIEYRLFLIILHVFGGRLPNEMQISAMFQTTSSQSKALLRAVVSKYQYELADAIADTMREVLERGIPDPNVPGGRIITISSESVIESLNLRVAAVDGSLPQIARLRGSVSSYQIAPATLAVLVESLQ